MHFILIVNSLLKLQKVLKDFLIFERKKNIKITVLFVDSPCVPPSANAHELFRGFSFVAPCLIGEEDFVSSSQQSSHVQTKAIESYSKVVIVLLYL